MDIIKIRGIILFIIAFLNLLLALFIFSKSKNDKTKFWLGILALSSGLFAFTCGGSYFFWQEYSITSAYWWRATWLGIFIIPSLNIFTYYFTKNTKNIIIKGIILYSVALVISFLALTTDLFVKTLYPNRSGMFLTGPTGSLDFLGRIFILVGFLIALTSLLRKYIKSSHDEKLKFNYFIFS